jgi:hypothetical protein
MAGLKELCSDLSRGSAPRGANVGLHRWRETKSGFVVQPLMLRAEWGWGGCDAFGFRKNIFLISVPTHWLRGKKR